MKKEVYLIGILVFFILLFPIINAQQPNPPQTNVNINVGLTIDFPKIQSIQINTDQTFNFHVFNISDGLRLDNTSVNCTFHLFNFTGDHILSEVDIPFDIPGNDWEIMVQGANFSHNRLYSILVDCRSVILGGFASLPFQVTSTGSIISEADSIIYFALALGAFFLFILCLWGGMVLPFRNKRAEAGSLIGVEIAKYPKVGLLFLSYVFLVWLINLLFTLANNFNILQPYRGFFRVIFGVLNSFSYPLFVIMLIFIMVLAIKDLKLKKLLDRGLNVGKEFSR